MFKQAIKSQYYTNSASYQELGDKVNVLAFFQGTKVKIVGFSVSNRRYKITSQNLSFQKQLGKYVWLCFAVAARDKTTNIESEFTLLFNPATRTWRIADGT